MRKNMLVGGTVLSLVVAMGAFPSAADKETRQMMADIRMLQEQTQQLQNLVATLSETVGSAVKTINARVDAKTEEQANTTRRAFTDQMVLVNGISSDVRVLKEKLDDNSVRVGQLTQEVEALRQIVSQLNSRPAFDPALGPPDGFTPSAPTGAAAVGASPTEFYNAANADYAAGQFDLAIKQMRTYITTFPGERAVDAQVVICRSYINLAKYDDAVKECDTAIRTYPSSDKLAEAYYLKGLAHENLKQTDQARSAYETVLKRFPGSFEVLLADQKLKGLAKR
jgi:TolA-binding protein